MKNMKDLNLHALHVLHGLKIKLAQVISYTFLKSNYHEDTKDTKFYFFVSLW
jgi:hypothetical protein